MGEGSAEVSVFTSARSSRGCGNIVTRGMSVVVEGGAVTEVSSGVMKGGTVAAGVLPVVCRCADDVRRDEPAGVRETTIVASTVTVLVSAGVRVAVLVTV